MNKLRNRAIQKAQRDERYKHTNQSPVSIKVTLIMGTVMHKCYLTFKDGNRFTLTIHKIGNVLVLAQPRLDMYTNEKLAVLNYLADLVFFNDNYLIVEQEDFYKYKIDSQINPVIFQEDTTVLSLSTELLANQDFEMYDIIIQSKQAKQYKFPTYEYQR